MKISLKISRRQAVIGGLALVGAGGAAAAVMLYLDQPPPDRSPEVGAMLMLGFSGRNSASQSARAVAGHLAAGRASGVMFTGENIGSVEEVQDLTRLFTADPAKPPLIAIDQEGGAGQPLTEGQGFEIMPPAQTVAQMLTPAEAKALYARSAHRLKELGFNTNLGPVVDLRGHDGPSSGDGRRSYGDDPAAVVAYAEAFIDAHHEVGILCAPKYFPGRGLALSDDSDSLIDVSDVWSETDLQPYVALIAGNRADLVIGGRVTLHSVESEPVPAMLSTAIVTGLLRDKLGFSGVAMTDDLDRAAPGVSRRDAVIKAIQAGNDLLVLRNVEAFEQHLPTAVVGWIDEAITKGELKEAVLSESADRVRALREKVAPPPAPEPAKSEH